MSAADISKAIGYVSPDKPVSWNKRDLLTYAVGIGAKEDDFQFVYELDPTFAAFPTYPVVLVLKGDGQDVNLFATTSRSAAPTPGLPRLDPNRMVHGSQSIEILKELPLVSGPGWKWTSKITGISENKSGLVIMAQNTLVDPTGVPYARLFSSSFNLGAKVTGTKFSKFIAGPPQAKPIPDRKPDYVVTDQISANQAVIFRLSGDYNPLHIDPKIGKAAGFGGVILHGLSTYGFAARAVLKALANNDPRALRLFGVRFTAPVKPGEGLETQIWEVGPGPDGTTEVTFVTKNTTTGKISLSGGIAYVRKTGKSKL